MHERTRQAQVYSCWQTFSFLLPSSTFNWHHAPHTKVHKTRELRQNCKTLVCGDDHHNQITLARQNVAPIYLGLGWFNIPSHAVGLQNKVNTRSLPNKFSSKSSSTWVKTPGSHNMVSQLVQQMLFNPVMSFTSMQVLKLMFSTATWQELTFVQIRECTMNNNCSKSLFIHKEATPTSWQQEMNALCVFVSAGRTTLNGTVTNTTYVKTLNNLF